MMETNAVLRGVRLSSQKGRLVADLIRGKSVDQALSILSFPPKKVRLLLKFLNQLLQMLSTMMGLILILCVSPVFILKRVLC